MSGSPPGAARPLDEAAEVDSVLADLLAGHSIDAVVEQLSIAAAGHVPGHRVVVAARSGPASARGRKLHLPRRVVTALDAVATSAGSGPGFEPAAAVLADPASPPWSAAASDLETSGLGAPLLLPLVDGPVLIGVLAAFPDKAAAVRVDRTTVEARLGRWARLATVALARDFDRGRLRRSAVEDDVTGLPGPSLLMARLREALHRRPRSSLAVVHVALDRLTDIEDGLGRGQRDDLLSTVGQCIRTVVRPGDVVGHLGTSTFAVICEDMESGEALEVSERIRVALVAPMIVGRHDVALGPGVGLVTATDVDTVNSLIHKAGIAAREAVERGGAEVVRYRPGTYEAAVARIDIERDLRHALTDRGLHLVYQPQVALADGAVVGAEALVRWDHPGRGAVSPDEFIPVAEETGLVVALGEWAVDTALADIAAGHLSVVVSVNVSARQLDEPGLVAYVTAALDRHQVDPARLRLEITESALVRDPERSGALLRALHAQGVRVSIDDFGTGYASLEHLRQVDVADSLKIDRTFVAGIVDDPRDRAIVAAAVTLGRSLGFTVVAEGVEDAAQAEILAEMGCDAAQGYWLGEPVAAINLAARISSV